ncbi:DUF4231 domain-containing protein [Kitasatospora azatica]|uniref:DUF4231 domain-containing protein n=1 Tax=Kitasatospora azatica TaxID=58347 RepID=UPI001E506472|nr:DUF4231 domain-containing protein [Kitasatospora azatica]
MVERRSPGSAVAEPPAGGDGRRGEDGDDRALAFAQRQLAFYRKSRDTAKFQHKASELLALVSTAGTVVVSALDAPAAVTATLAALTLFLTGYRQLFTPNERWTRTSVAWLTLHHEIARYLQRRPAERDSDALLERTIEISQTESSEWIEARRAQQSPGPAAPGRSGPM